jgi:hypothetical protein
MGNTTSVPKYNYGTKVAAFGGNMKLMNELHCLHLYDIYYNVMCIGRENVIIQYPMEQSCINKIVVNSMLKLTKGFPLLSRINMLQPIAGVLNADNA